MEHEGDGDTDCDWCTRYNPQKLGKGTRKLRNQSQSREHPNYIIIKIGQKTEMESCCLSESGEKPSANAGVKNSQKSIIISRPEDQT